MQQAGVLVVVMPYLMPRYPQRSRPSAGQGSNGTAKCPGKAPATGLCLWSNLWPLRNPL